MEQIFARNPEERQALSDKCVAIVGCGSVGGSSADIAARTGVGKLILIDPDCFAPENIGRHVLTATSLGKSKVHELARHLSQIHSDLEILPIQEKFNGRLPERPDLIISAVDSFACESLVNGYSLAAKVPTIYVGVWGAARIAEIYYVVPGRTGCYQCFASFRRAQLEMPTDNRKYTDPDFDETKVPGQAGLWANILIANSLAFQVALGLFGLRPELINYENNLWLMNISDFDSPLQPLAVTFGKLNQKGCPICDPSKLDELTIYGRRHTA